jgi:hypothetical protein
MGMIMKAPFVPALVPDAAPDVPAPVAVQPLVTDIRGIAVILGCSTATVRRLIKEDPEFPRLIRLRKGGEQYGRIADFRSYIAMKFSQPKAA